MHERNRDRCFFNSRGNTLYIAAVHISDSKNPRQCCFQQVWPAAERPVRVAQFLRRQIGTGLDEAFAVEHDAAAQSVCIRVGSGHDKHVKHSLDNKVRLFAGSWLPTEEGQCEKVELEIPHVRPNPTRSK